jgi:hypothetical protein
MAAASPRSFSADSSPLEGSSAEPPRRTTADQRRRAPGLEASPPDEAAMAAEAVRFVRAAQAAGSDALSSELASPLALRRERARLAHHLGSEAASSFWSEARAETEAVRVLREGEAEVYERAPFPRLGVTLRFVSLVRREQGAWRLVDTTDAGDERVTVVLLRGASASARLDMAGRLRRWIDARQASEPFTWEAEGATLREPDAGWTALVRSGTGLELARSLGASGPSSLLLEAQPAATLVTMRPALDATARTAQLRWLARAAAALGAPDASSVWVPSAAKVIPYAEWAEAATGPLDLPRLAPLWLRVERGREAWVTRGLSTLMLPEVELVGRELPAVIVRAFLREVAGRLFAHHRARIAGGLGASAPAVPEVAPRLFWQGPHGPEPLPVDRTETQLELGAAFALPPLEGLVARGRQGPEPGESYGRWGSIAVAPRRLWWGDRGSEPGRESDRRRPL